MGYLVIWLFGYLVIWLSGDLIFIVECHFERSEKSIKVYDLWL